MLMCCWLDLFERHTWGYNYLHVQISKKIRWSYLWKSRIWRFARQGQRRSDLTEQGAFRGMREVEDNWVWPSVHAMESETLTWLGTSVAAVGSSSSVRLLTAAQINSLSKPIWGCCSLRRIWRFQTPAPPCTGSERANSLKCWLC